MQETNPRCRTTEAPAIACAALLLLALLPLPAAAASGVDGDQPIDASDTPATSQATIHAITNAFGPVSAGDAAPKMAVTVRLKDEAARIDFTDPRGRDGYLLSPGAKQGAWLVSVAGNVALPLPRPPTRFWLDPARPCRQMQASCAPSQGEVIAGRVTQGWRYRNASGRGPDGTDRGTLWVDAETGLMLGYRGQVAGRDGEREMRAVSVSYDGVPDTVFELPRTLDQLDAAPRERR